MVPHNHHPLSGRYDRGLLGGISCWQIWKVRRNFGKISNRVGRKLHENITWVKIEIYNSFIHFFSFVDSLSPIYLTIRYIKNITYFDQVKDMINDYTGRAKIIINEHVWFSRKGATLFSHIPAFIGAVVSCVCLVAQAPELLMVGRFITGINCGKPKLQ